MKKRNWLAGLLALSLLVLPLPVEAASGNGNVSLNVLLNTDITDQILKDLGKYGQVTATIPSIDAVLLNAKGNALQGILALDFVTAANPDAQRNAAPIDMVSQTDFSTGASTWPLDAMNITNPGQGRTVPYDGTDTYVAVLDTGLNHNWRAYFPEERIAEEYARSFGGGPNGNVASQPNKWEKDVNNHGTHVTSSILGFSLNGTPVNGAATGTTVIPVKVLNQNGSGWSSVIAEGITYIADLKLGELADYPVVINMSLGGSVLDAVEKAAIDYALEAGVIIVASAGNNGEAGMGYPGAYEPVISVGAYGWAGTFVLGWTGNVAEPTNPAQFYMADFSSRELDGQDLDITAPGAWVVGPYQLNSSNASSFYYLSGTSMASPHVAGLVALMAQKNPALTAAEAEMILETTALPMGAGTLTVAEPTATGTATYTWGADAVGSGMVDAQAALNAIP